MSLKEPVVVDARRSAPVPCRTCFANSALFISCTLRPCWPPGCTTMGGAPGVARPRWPVPSTHLQSSLLSGLNRRHPSVTSTTRLRASRSDPDVRDEVLQVRQRQFFAVVIDQHLDEPESHAIVYGTAWKSGDRVRREAAIDQQFGRLTGIGDVRRCCAAPTASGS